MGRAPSKSGSLELAALQRIRIVDQSRQRHPVEIDRADDRITRHLGAALGRAQELRQIGAVVRIGRDADVRLGAATPHEPARPARAAADCSTRRRQLCAPTPPVSGMSR